MLTLNKTDEPQERAAFGDQINLLVKNRWKVNLQFKLSISQTYVGTTLLLILKNVLIYFKKIC